MYGDICYLKVKPTDGEGFCVTATTEGYYINKVCVGVWVSERGCVYCAMTLGEERVSIWDLCCMGECIMYHVRRRVLQWLCLTATPSALSGALTLVHSLLCSD